MTKKIIRNKEKGILFWITGLSGSGKTIIAKKIYRSKKNQYIVGTTIKPEFPKQPEIVIKNDFKKSVNVLANDLLQKIMIKINQHS